MRHRALDQRLLGKGLGRSGELTGATTATCRARRSQCGEVCAGGGRDYTTSPRGAWLAQYPSLWREPRQSGIWTGDTDPHTLRHAFITAALDAGVPLRDVQEAASHADPKTTMRYDRARVSLDLHATNIVAAFLALSHTGDIGNGNVVSVG